MSVTPRQVQVDLREDASVEVWAALVAIAGELPEEWVVVGGVMVQLHALERGVQDVRITRDIDLLVQARPQGALSRVAMALSERGFVADTAVADGYAHRFARDGVIIDLLAPDGIKPPPRLFGRQKAIGVPGGSQALSRAEEVKVLVCGRPPFVLRRPTLLGAILIKARALMTHADPDAQREDLLRLLSLIEDPRAPGMQLKTSERRWLRAAEPRLAPDRSSGISGDTTRLARLAVRVLIDSSE